MLTCAYFTYWSDVPVAGAGLYSRPERMIVALPTNDGRTLTIVFFPNDAFHEVRADIEGHFMRVLDLAPQLAERVRNGKHSERFLGTADLPFFFRKSYDPSWALVGDADYHKDPITAQGITDAFRDAELLIEALDAGLSGKLPPEEALANYEQRWNEAALPMYELTHQLAALQPPPPEMQQLVAVLCHNQEQTKRFSGTITGTVPIAEFFAPENPRADHGHHNIN